MAVIEDDAAGASQASTGVGTVQIADRCVTFINDRGTRLLLVWRSAEVRWNPADRAIEFTHKPPDGSKLTINDGASIEVGGEDFDSDPGGVTREVEWLAEPDPSCDSPRFIVNSVTAAP